MAADGAIRRLPPIEVETMSLPPGVNRDGGGDVDGRDVQLVGLS